MEINSIQEGVLKQTIKQLDKKMPSDNPSIFLSENEDSKIDNDFIYKNLYQ